MNLIIDGIKVLEQNPIKDYTSLSKVLLAVGILIAIIDVIIFIINTKGFTIQKMHKFKKYAIIYLLGLFASIFSCVPLPCFYTETGRYTYECKLEDNISANYIEENFDVVSVEDGIWIIKDKEICYDESGRENYK